MMTYAYMCNQCQALFELPEPLDLPDERDTKCPECGSTNIERLHICSVDVCLDESGPPPWEYVCYQCKSYFQIPVPRGPAEEKETKCPECGSGDIERVDVGSHSVCPPGG